MNRQKVARAVARVAIDAADLTRAIGYVAEEFEKLAERVSALEAKLDAMEHPTQEEVMPSSWNYILDGPEHRMHLPTSKELVDLQEQMRESFLRSDKPKGE